jgi:hypothetical protein
MTLTMYLTLFAVAIVGMALHTALKLKGLQDKARLANVEFKVVQYFKNDWLSITASVLTVVLCLFLTENILAWKPQAASYLKIGYAFVGYTGSDIASRLFGVVNRKINTAIDYKTTVADAAQGNTEAPTPLPEKKPLV